MATSAEKSDRAPSASSSSFSSTAAAGALDPLEPRFVELIAQEANATPRQVAAASALFAEGATVPFVARYRKEATGGLDDAAVETVAKRRDYFLELQQRRDAILASIAEQGKLDDGLEASIRAATGKQELEDLYLPYKPKRRTRAQIAREKGLEPLADALLAAAESAAGGDLEAVAGPYVDAERGVDDSDAALAGARDILAERLAERAEHRAALRRGLQGEGDLKVRVLRGKGDDPAALVYRDYFEHDEPIARVPSHRLLAILRGEREGFLLSDLAVDDDAWVERFQGSWNVRLDTPAGREVATATADGYKRLLRPSITNEVRGELRARAEAEAIAVFRENLEALMLQSPLGLRPVMGLDPGFRTGCKLAVVDGTGRVLTTSVIYPIEPRARAEQAVHTLLELIRRHDIHAVAIGNGTGSRETERFVRTTLRSAAESHPELGKVIVAIVPETGASVYSASAAAREELPELDVSLRGAVSIARRLQDPLAELVKIEPRALGVGQYQHDVDQKRLDEELDLAVEGAVNAVGVELNSASPSLLRRVSGLSERMARAIVAHRDAAGVFRSRRQLLEVRGFGPKTYEQAAGFLRVRDGEHPLDRTAVHPERYELVEAMAESIGQPVDALVGDPNLVASLSLDRFRDDAAGVGRFTLEDIRVELERPGRDPRPEYRAPAWRDDVTELADLKSGMTLEGRVSNVTNFGAFVDLGVKRDGLVHLSQLSDEWVDDPRQVVRVGQIVTVRVVEVDHDRQRIGLSMKSEDAPVRGGGGGGGAKNRGPSRGHRGGNRGKTSPPPPKGPATKASLQDLAKRFKRR
ncbi:MAG: Tex family protein [Acidobacteriota bacterium]